MKNTYFDLMDQTYYFPQEGFDLRDGYLTFHGISLHYLIKKYGTPLRLMYLPHIGEQIRRAKNLYNRSIHKNSYKGKDHYCYGPRCCHFSALIYTALKEGVHLEASSSFELDMINKLHNEGQIKNSKILIHNDYKTREYISKIIELYKAGFKNSITIPDSLEELKKLMAPLFLPTYSIGKSHVRNLHIKCSLKVS